MSYFKNDVHLLFLPIPYTNCEQVNDYLCNHYESPEHFEGTYETIVQHINNDHLVLYVVCNPYERMIRALFSLGKITSKSTKEEVFSKLQFFPTQFSYVSLNDKLVHSKILHTETLNQDMKTIGYDFNGTTETISYMDYLHDKSIYAINEFYEKDFEMFQYEKRIPKPKHSYVQQSISDSYYPSQYASLYGWNTYVNTDAVIFVCSFGGSLGQAVTTSVGTNIVKVNTSDVHTYWSNQGITASTLYMYTSPDADTNSDSNIENNMDCSILGSLCGCTIVLCVFSPYDTFTTAFQFMLSGVTVSNTLIKPTHITISWGTPESMMDEVDKTLYLTLKNSGVIICAAAGDSGSCDGTNVPTCDFPASCPYIISVGGTSIQSVSPFREKVWNDGINATGGGVSSVFSKPSYQTCSGTMRNVPDIASISDPNTGIDLYYNGTFNSGNGGTSMASPFVTAMFAITGFQCKQQNHLTSYPNVISNLYSLSCFNNSIPGNNSIDNIKGYSYVPGFDDCTGLGSIQWNKYLISINNIYAPTPPPPPPPPTPTIPTRIILKKPYKINLSNATYFIQNTTIAYILNNIIYPRKKGITYLYIHFEGKWYKCDLKV